MKLQRSDDQLWKFSLHLSRSRTWKYRHLGSTELTQPQFSPLLHCYNPSNSKVNLLDLYQCKSQPDQIQLNSFNSLFTGKIRARVTINSSERCQSEGGGNKDRIWQLWPRLLKTAHQMMVWKEQTKLPSKFVGQIWWRHGGGCMRLSSWEEVKKYFWVIWSNLNALISHWKGKQQCKQPEQKEKRWHLMLHSTTSHLHDSAMGVQDCPIGEIPGGGPCWCP